MKLAKIAFSLILTFSLAVAGLSAAQAQYGLEETAGAAGLKSAELPVRVGQVINVALGVIGLVFLILAVYAGFKIMLSQGDSDAISTGKNTLLYAVIGMIVVSSAYALASFVISRIVR